MPDITGDETTNLLRNLEITRGSAVHGITKTSADYNVAAELFVALTAGCLLIDSMTPQEEPVYARLGALGIAFDRHEHPPVATADEAERHWAGIDAMHFKNLFLRNQKGTRHYLVIVRHPKRADLRGIADQLGDGKLSFASPERLMTHLGVTPGSVSPFGLIHDRAKVVRVAIDRDLKSADRVSFHPNINTVTVTLARTDFEKFLDDCRNTVRYVAV